MTLPTAEDISLLGELYETIERKPPAIEARKLLVQQLLTFEWHESARDAVRELLSLNPNDAEVQALSAAVDNNKSLVEQHTAVKAEEPSTVCQLNSQKRRAIPKVELSKDIKSSQNDLCVGYGDVRKRARDLEEEVRLLRGLYEKMGLEPPLAHHVPVLSALSDGLVASVLRPPPTASARSVAEQMARAPQKALDIAFEDLARLARANTVAETKADSISKLLSSRVTALCTALSSDLQREPRLALMHVEHECLKRTYCLTETMYGDPVSDIPRSNFWVSEDGYPWDLDELVQALKSNGGVMRNPLTKDLFSSDDIRAIVQHPLGKPLAALHVEQEKMSRGVRPVTVEKLQHLAAAILADMSDDQIPSRTALDEFLSYMATLPDAEQKALDLLRVPAKDRHTGQSFDTSIGDAVRDATGNRVCFHKVGDLLGQAAQFLRDRG